MNKGGENAERGYPGPTQGEVKVVTVLVVIVD